MFIALCFIVFFIAYGEKFYKLNSNFMSFFVYSSVFYSLLYRLRREILQIKIKFYEIFLFIALCFIVFFIAYGEKFYKLNSNYMRFFCL